MKKQLLTLVAVLSLVLMAGAAQAQTISVKADVPFNFQINKQEMPKGAYSVQSLRGSSSHALVLKNEDGGETQIVLANSIEIADPSSQTKLVFNRYGDEYFLAQVWVEGHTLGHQFSMSTREKELASAAQPERVLVAANRY